MTKIEILYEKNDRLKSVILGYHQLFLKKKFWKEQKKLYL